MDNGWSRLVVLVLRDPHLLEGAETGKDGASDPDGILALGRCNNLDLHGRGRESRDLLLHPVCDSRIHRSAAREDGIGIKVLTDVDVTLHDRVVGCLVDARGFHAEERGLEHRLRATEALVTDRYHLFRHRKWL